MECGEINEIRPSGDLERGLEKEINRIPIVQVIDQENFSFSSSCYHFERFK